MKKTSIIYLVLIAIAICIPVSGQIYSARYSMEHAISEQRVPGYLHIAKFGVNDLVEPLTTPEDVWEGGGEYPFSANGVFPDIGVADIVSVSSSDASDVQDILVFGLDVDGYQVTQLITLQGQTRVALTTPLWRVYRIENWDDTSFAGTVYVYSGTANTAGVPSGGSITKALVDDGNNQTQMAVYTIPRGMVGFLVRAEVGFGFSGSIGAGTQEVRFAFKARTYGQVFKIKKSVYLVSSSSSEHTDWRPFHDVLPELSDILICVKETTDDVSAWGTFHVMLVEEEKLPQSLLDSIGQ
jgi:hypothetical protein